MSSFVTDFRLSVTTALRDQLLVALEDLEPAALSLGAIEQLLRRGGVYQLFEDKVLVYVGKSTRDLPGRLSMHRSKIDGRVGGLIDRMSFRCAYVDEDLDAVAPETLLISHLRNEGLANWNANGFGNKDPGANRDRSIVKEAHFDRLHPINLDKLVIPAGMAGARTLLDLMAGLKTALPYNFRYGTDRNSRRELSSTILPGQFVSKGMPAKDWFVYIAAQLPLDWTITALPGYVIAYPGLDPAAIQSRIGAWVRYNQTISFEPHEAVFAPGEVPADDDAQNE